jgi:hypothetical protein
MLGISQPTVSRARKKAATDTDVSVVRIGRDGRKRKPPAARTVTLINGKSYPKGGLWASSNTPADKWQAELATQAAAAANAASDTNAVDWSSFTITSDLVELAQEAARAWSDLADRLQDKLNFQNTHPPAERADTHA